MLNSSIRLLVSVSIVSILQACAPANRGELSALKTDESALVQKIDSVWSVYKTSRGKLLKKVHVDKSEMSRAEWETLLASAPALTAAEVQALRTMHNGITEKSKKLARDKSRLNLDKVRSDGKTAEFCREFPKGAMLHIHPWGTLDEETARKILTAVNPEIDFTNLKSELSVPGDSGIFYPQELAALDDLIQKYQGREKFLQLATGDQDTVVRWFFLPAGPRDFGRFLGVFTVISKLAFANKNVDPEPMMYDAFFRRAAKHNVQYVEISQFIKPFPSWVKGLESWAKSVKADHNVEVSLLAAFSRAKDADATRKSTDKLLKLPRSPRLTVVNFLADEEAHPALKKGQTLYVPLLAATESGDTTLKGSMHAGELGDIRNSRDAIIMGVQRIGHGVKIMEDPLTLELARREGIHIETNLISNYRLGVVASIKDHPFLHYLRLGLPVSWSTDDEGIFESTISDECIAAVDQTDISYTELQSLARNGLQGAFIGDAVKSTLLSELDAKFQKFEARWAPYLN
jgi:adenosine deaminase